MTKIKVCLDPGHGMGNVRSGVMDSGATANGLWEATVTLRICDAIAQDFDKKSVPYFMTRRDQVTPDPVGQRDDIAEKAGCTHFVSIHTNSADSPQATGSEVYYRDAPDRGLAVNIHGFALAAFGLKDRGEKVEGQSQHSRLAVFDFDGPCCLEEIGFITNVNDRRAMLDPVKQKHFASLVGDYFRMHMDIVKGQTIV